MKTQNKEILKEELKNEFKDFARVINFVGNTLGIYLKKSANGKGENLFNLSQVEIIIKYCRKNNIEPICSEINDLKFNKVCKEYYEGEMKFGNNKRLIYNLYCNGFEGLFKRVDKDLKGGKE
jgi:hypothetical protein